jgi:hypothetical protein
MTVVRTIACPQPSWHVCLFRYERVSPLLGEVTSFSVCERPASVGLSRECHVRIQLGNRNRLVEGPCTSVANDNVDRRAMKRIDAARRDLDHDAGGSELYHKDPLVNPFSYF